MKKIFKYIKPTLVVCDGLSEGVYTASGNPTSSKIRLSSQNGGNEHYPTKQYTITFMNNGAEKVSNLNLQFSFVGNVSEVNTFGNAIAQIIGNKISITFDNWQQGIEAGDYREIDIAVTGTWEFFVENL